MKEHRTTVTNSYRKDVQKRDPIPVVYPLPETIEEAIDTWGGPLCLDRLNSQIVIEVQNAVRQRMDDGKKRAADGSMPKMRDGTELFLPDHELLEIPKSWVPVYKEPKLNKAARTVKSFKELDKAAKLQALEDLREEIRLLEAAEVSDAA